MKVLDTDLAKVKIVEPDVFGDERGFFMETWNRTRYLDAGMDIDCRQTNLSRSRRGVLRGLHFQQPNPQGKLVYVIEGEVLDVAVDIRVGSPDFGRWTAARLSGKNRRQMWVPEGFAHGFCVLSESALFAYGCTTEYDPEADRTLRFDDPAIGVDWPVERPELSDKDRNAPNLDELREAGMLPDYASCAS